MKRLSVPNAWTSKYLVPAGFFGAFAFFLLNGLAQSTEKFMVAVMFLAVGLFVMWRLFLSKVDEVHDCGDTILVKNRKREVVIPLQDIQSVRLVEGREPFIRIELKQRTPLGDRIDFFDGTRYRFFGRVQASAGVRSLMDRIRIRDEASAREAAVR